MDPTLTQILSALVAAHAELDQLREHMRQCQATHKDVENSNGVPMPHINKKPGVPGVV